MVITGGCRGNGTQLAVYMLDTKENERAEVIAIEGTAFPNNLRKSFLEMSLTSELSGRTDDGLYHAQLSPRIYEAREMTTEQKKRMVEIFIEVMEMPKGTKYGLVEQEKDGRIHFHLGLERYNHETKIMWNDEGNYAKHQAAARKMELEFNWELTHEKRNRLDLDVKAHLLKIWKQNENPSDFIKAMDKYGFEVTQGIGKRPYEFVDRHGTKFDLARQLDGVTQQEVAERMNPIRKTLRETAISCHERRADEQEIKLETQSDNSRKLSDIETPITSDKMSYSFKFEQPLFQPAKEEPKETGINVDETQDLFDAMIKHHKKRTKEEEQAEQVSLEATQAAIEATKKAEEAARILADLRSRRQPNKDKGLGLDM